MKGILPGLADNCKMLQEFYQNLVKSFLRVGADGAGRVAAAITTKALP